jgi:serine/threonine protein kinase
VVYLARNKQMDRLEVLKVVNRALLDRPGTVERFLREIRSAAALEHKNVVRAYACLQVGKLLALVMEYVEGEDLAHLVDRRGPLSISSACSSVIQAACGLQEAHNKGMVHRDIKPQNLLLSRKLKEVMILDFGLAKVASEKAVEQGLTAAGKMLGTPGYVAPEQILDAAKADIRADIYSLGCTLYYLVRGHPPFDAPSLFVLLQAHQFLDARPLNEERPDVPPELAAVVAKMMAKEPAKRYQQPIEVAQALAPFIKPGGKKSAAGPSPSLSQRVAAEEAASAKDSPVAKDPKVRRASTPGATVGGKDERSAPSAPEKHSRADGDTLRGSRSTSSESRGGVGASKRRSAAVEQAARKRWLFIGAGVAAGVLLIGLAVLCTVVVFQGVVPLMPSGKVAAYEHGGKWRIEGDDLIQQDAEVNDVRLLFGDPSWTDYDVTVDVQRISGDGLCWVGFRLTDWLNGFAFGTAEKSRGIITKVDSVARSLDRGAWASDGEWHTMGVQVRGGRIQCSMDGEKNVFKIDDDHHPKGYVALATQKLAARFRNLKVTDPGGGLLLDGVRNLDIASGKGSPVNQKVGVGTIWKGKLKRFRNGKEFSAYDGTIKILKRDGTGFEGEFWCNSWSMKIAGNIDPIGNITWRATDFLVRGGLSDENLSVLVGGVVKGNLIRAYVQFSDGSITEVTVTRDG